MPNDARARLAALALAIDSVLIVVFATTGRASHGSEVVGALGAGLAKTAWPFLASLAVAWLVVLAWRRPFAPLRTGLPVWLITVGGGMLLRLASGQGTAVPFLIVAASTLLAMLVGWRLIVMLVRRGQRRPPTPDARSRASRSPADATRTKGA